MPPPIPTNPAIRPKLTPIIALIKRPDLERIHSFGLFTSECLMIIASPENNRLIPRIITKRDSLIVRVPAKKAAGIETDIIGIAKLHGTNSFRWY